MNIILIKNLIKKQECRLKMKSKNLWKQEM
jgi:hypothetical protein